jgi:hypothetical protein
MAELETPQGAGIITGRPAEGHAEGFTASPFEKRPSPLAACCPHKSLMGGLTQGGQ